MFFSNNEDESLFFYGKPYIIMGTIAKLVRQIDKIFVIKGRHLADGKIVYGYIRRYIDLVIFVLQKAAVHRTDQITANM